MIATEEGGLLLLICCAAIAALAVAVWLLASAFGTARWKLGVAERALELSQDRLRYTEDRWKQLRLQTLRHKLYAVVDGVIVEWEYKP
jgi:uncharacterized membrane protein HdeD (DUF308 family)